MKVHAKRCEKFLANPKLINLLTKRRISFSKNDTAKISTQEDSDDLEKTKSIHKKSKTHRNKTATDTFDIEDSELLDNNTNIVEDIAVSKEL